MLAISERTRQSLATVHDDGRAIWAPISAPTSAHLQRRSQVALADFDDDDGPLVNTGGIGVVEGANCAVLGTGRIGSDAADDGLGDCMDPDDDGDELPDELGRRQHRGLRRQ